MQRSLLPYLLGACVFVTEARAAETIGFDEALGLGEAAPAVVGAERALARKRAFNAAISSQTQPVQLAVQPGYRLLPQAAREPELLVELLHTWNLSGLAGARRRSALTEEEVLRAEVRELALAKRIAAARAWIDVWAAEKLLAAATEEQRLVTELERLVERTAALSESTRADLLQARAFRSEAEIARLAAEGEVHQRGLRLGAEVGRALPEPLGVRGELPWAPLPPEAEWPRYLALAGALPEVVRRELEARAVRAREVEERAQRGTQGQFGVVLQRDAPGGLVLSAAARLYLPLFDRGERERGVTAAQAERLAGEHQAALRAAVAELALSFHEVEHSGALLRVLEEKLVPESREGARLRARIYQAGEATIYEVLEARRIAAQAERRLVEARAQHAWARMKTWLLLVAVAAPRPGGAR